MRYRARSLPTVAIRTLGAKMLVTWLVAATLTQPAALGAQAHEHGADPSSRAATRDARLDLTLGGPHLILYHRGYLSLDEQQVASLQQLRRTVCEAEVVYVAQASQWREQLSTVLADSAVGVVPPPKTSSRPARLQDVMSGLAGAESQWLTVLLQTRRDALALLTASQRAQAAALRDHWARESAVMIEEATRPGQRGHPGTQIPIRVPGMVVEATTLLPYCESLHGASLHISIPPPR